MSVKTVTTGATSENHQYNWVIQNFAIVQSNKQLVEEQQFEINSGVDSKCHSIWKVGLNVFHDTHIGLYCTLLRVINCNQEDPVVPMGFKMEVRYRDGNTVKKSNQQTLKPGETCKFERIWTFNWPNWSSYLDATGNLKIAFTLTLFVDSEKDKLESPFTRFELLSKQKLHEDLARLLETSSGSDVTLVSSNGEEFPCHKLLLSCRSSYFARLFQSGLSESTTGLVQMDDLSGKAVKVLIHYFYTGKLLDIWMEPEVTVELTYAAEKYHLENILQLLDETLGTLEPQNGENLVALLELANKLSLQNAEKQLRKQIARLAAKAENTDQILSIVG